MPPELIAFFQEYPWALQALKIFVFFLLAWLVTRLSGFLAARLVRLGGFAQRGHKVRPERLMTLQSLVASAINFLALVVATLASLSLFVSISTLIWVVGLFSAAFGLGARPVISDVLIGISYLFEDTFAVGEKVEILGMEGVIEAINLRTTWMRAPTGELYTIPNGEIRTVRNFSRGLFSVAHLTIKVHADDLVKALERLEGLGEEAVLQLPNLLEPWQVLSEGGVIGQHTELTILAKARFGKAAEMQPRLLAFVHEQLKEAQINLAE
ncbi:MAG: mechanosensitive ion channel [Anaerolineales bacterium]|nr:mechanosensitive ion channel [Anaerolineales bacterium]